MYDIVSVDKCVGCGVCAAVCPHSAIHMSYDNEGFLAPSIDSAKCVDCSLCRKVCPAQHDLCAIAQNQTAYCAYNQHEDIRSASTSGGIFTEIAHYVLEQKGSVFGVCMDGSHAIHRIAENKAELAQMRGSKYIQSRCEVYPVVKQHLDNHRLVLFTGTPCQVDALKHYLRKDYDNLITCEVACYGVGSQKVFEDFLKHITPHGAKVAKISFRKKGTRHKPSAFSVEFDKGKVYQRPSYLNYFGYTFSKHLITRKSCTACVYSSKTRCADFSLGDYSEPDSVAYNTQERQNGLSLLFVNSDKGHAILSKLPSLCLDKKNIDKIKSIAFLPRSNSPLMRTQFFADYSTTGFSNSFAKYSSEIKKTLRNNRKNKIKGSVRSVLKKLLK